MLAKTPVSASPLTKTAMTVPTATPTRMGSAQLRSMGQSTAPFFAWARTERMEVRMIVPSDVPTARCMRTASSMPSSVKT